MFRIQRMAIPIVLLCLGGTGINILADEGRIPLWEATTITAPGKYIVTRDIYPASGSAIIVEAIGVSIDLDGHILRANAGSPVVVIDTALASGPTHVVNGVIVGGDAGVATTNTNRADVSLKDLLITDPTRSGVEIDKAGSVVIARCQIQNTGEAGIRLNPDAPDESYSARILDSTLQELGGGGMEIWGLREGIIRGNVVQAYGSAVANVAGITLHGGPGVGSNVVEKNIVNAAPYATDKDGLYVSLPSSNNVIRGNTVADNGRFGIFVGSDTTRVIDNVVNSNGSHGIEVAGSNNYLEGNQTQGNGGCGVSFLNSNAHVYRDNMAYSNTDGGICNGGSPNLDAGGNVP